MLNPDERHLLTDVLRPPTGWRVDSAIATTYTLDLFSLLLAPLSMAAYDQTSEDPEKAAPHELLEAIRRYAERTTVFCQAGGIHVPNTYRKLTVFAEDAIAEVLPPEGKVFHPKIWLLRFTNPSGDQLHRFACLSRNLTGDRSWDTMLSVDEDETGGGQLSGAPVADFILELMSRTARPFSTERDLLVRDVAATTRERTFAVPAPFSGGVMLPFGTDAGHRWPVPPKVDKAVVISPFLDVTTVRRLPAGTTIVSRAEAFDRIGQAELAPHHLFVLQPHADAPPEELETEAATGPQASPTLEVKTGLHAKVIAWDTGTEAHLLTGSANATSAAFGGNLEFGVLLTGTATRCGAAAILKDSDKETGLMRLVQPHVASEEPVPDPTYTLEKEIETFHVSLVGAGPGFTVDEAEHGYVVTLGWREKPRDIGITRVRPITLKAEYNRALNGEGIWPGLGHTDLTPFLAVHTQVERDGVTVERASVVRADLMGAPEDRSRRVLRELLPTVEDVLRYLALLLQDASIDEVVSTVVEMTDRGGEGGSDRPAWLDDLILLEPIVRAYARQDGSLERIRRLLEDLRDDEGRLPQLGRESEDLWRDFENLWRIVAPAGEAR